MPAFLARRYDAVVGVERRDDQTVAFAWRGRRYLVAAVLDHWWETTAWWAVDPAGGVVDDERELWRVEAVTRTGVTVVVELCFAWSTGIWTVAAVLD